MAHPNAATDQENGKNEAIRGEPDMFRWYLTGWFGSFDFSGRSRRGEFWTFLLVNLFVFALLAVGFPELGQVFLVLMVLPSLAVCVRRLHDTGLFGWWTLAAFLPPMSLLFLYFVISDSQPGGNQYGPNPKGVGNGNSDSKVVSKYASKSQFNNN